MTDILKCWVRESKADKSKNSVKTDHFRPNILDIFMASTHGLFECLLKGTFRDSRELGTLNITCKFTNLKCKCDNEDILWNVLGNLYSE